MLKILQLALEGCFCLLLGWAAFQDYQSASVSNGIWWLCILCAVGKLWIWGMPTWDIWMELLVFLLAQEVVMPHFYGKADSHAFSCCGLMWTAAGRGLWEDIYLMGLTLLLFTIVQLHNRNVTKCGVLRTPRPMVPYIYASYSLLWIGDLAYR